MATQICKQCNTDKPETDYYVQDGYRLFLKCKECTLAPKRKGRICGFRLLPEQTQTDIIAAIPTMKVRQIATKYGVNYPNLVYWIRSGKLRQNE